MHLVLGGGGSFSEAEAALRTGGLRSLCVWIAAGNRNSLVANATPAGTDGLNVVTLS